MGSLSETGSIGRKKFQGGCEVWEDFAPRTPHLQRFSSKPSAFLFVKPDGAIAPSCPEVEIHRREHEN